MWELARELANSGEYSDWYAIQMELRDRGYPRARQLLDNERVRERLDQACANARSGSMLMR